MKRTLKTVSEVVEAFGGTSAAAEWAGIGPSAVSNWLSKGFIPPGWHFRMADYFDGKGIALSRKVFGEEEDDTRPKKRQALQPAA